MRRAYSPQRRFDCSPIAEVPLNFECRDEIIPILAALQHVYCEARLRRAVTNLVKQDLNADTSPYVGRRGMDYWHVVVLSAVRLGCNLDYDKLQNLAEDHRSLRGILGVGEWDDSTSFTFRRIRDTLGALQSDTIKKINQLIVRHGQTLHGEASKAVRADSFVIETNIHYPTESSLIWDGMQKIVPLCVGLAAELNQPGWRQHHHLLKKIKKLHQQISLVSASKAKGKRDAVEALYVNLIQRSDYLLERANTLCLSAETECTATSLRRVQQLAHWIELTQQVRDTAHRRIVLGERVPNVDKLFSLFESHTQLYQRGKAGEPVQFGRMALIFEDAAGFISHYHLMDREATDSSVIVEQTRKAQKIHRGEINKASFDRGFHSADNEAKLSTILNEVCCPPKRPAAYAERLANASMTFRLARQRHPGIESAIGALQSGNGLKRCRDRSEPGMERYLGLAILGRNLHVLGKLLIAREHRKAAAAISKRKGA